MKIRPLGDKVLVERVEAESKTAGGIVLPDTAKEKPQRGKIVSVVLGVTAYRGRLFNETDDRPGGGPEGHGTPHPSLQWRHRVSTLCIPHCPRVDEKEGLASRHGFQTISRQSLDQD